MRRSLSTLLSALLALGPPWARAQAAGGSREAPAAPVRVQLGGPSTPVPLLGAPAPAPALGAPAHSLSRGGLLLPGAPSARAEAAVSAPGPAPAAAPAPAPASLILQAPAVPLEASPFLPGLPGLAGRAIEARGPPSSARLIAPRSPLVEVPAGTAWRGTLREMSKTLALHGADRQDLARSAELLERVYDNAPPRGYAATEAGLLVPESALAASGLEPAGPRGDSPSSAGPPGGWDRHSRIPHFPGPKRHPLFWLAVAAAATLGGTYLMSHMEVAKGLLTEATGWAGNAMLMFFPVIQIRTILKDLRAARGDGPEASEARDRLAGVNAWAHVTLKSGKLLQFPAYLKSGSPALMGNALIRSGLSLAVLALLKAGGRISWTGFLLPAAWFTLALGAAPLLAAFPDLISVLATAGAAVYSLFAVPQYLSNHRALNELGHVDVEKAASAYQRMLSNGFLYNLLVLAGSLLLIPAYLASGLLWVAAANLFVSLIAGLILVQMGQVRLLPWQQRKK